ncbi:hypothetical protein GTCCBUS3UF5_19970 [Geobacillus thermoleovorans CCB_US3_UF5]|uniref:Uncharacterized protein n=1 Tax=Geobacillus thermoleovorans CCB_US3_UF5 TaxID=1111068 RepID=A0ABM5MI23_GEOTH|nr:hypothetical protein GTCCBUS3UF5_19970 [Geobacillus thermoleovorans CCB_US3_UF5]
MCQGFIRHRNEKILPIFVERVRNVSYFLHFLILLNKLFSIFTGYKKI